MSRGPSCSRGTQGGVEFGCVLRRLARVRLEQSSQGLLDLHFVGLDDAVAGQRDDLFPSATQSVGNAIADALMGTVLVEEDPVLIQSALQATEPEEDQVVQTLTTR